jgi:hypothetical protein
MITLQICKWLEFWILYPQDSCDGHILDILVYTDDELIYADEVAR